VIGLELHPFVWIKCHFSYDIVRVKLNLDELKLKFSIQQLQIFSCGKIFICGRHSFSRYKCGWFEMCVSEM